MSSFVYIQTEGASAGFPGLWTVGVYDGDGKFQPESDHNDSEEAAKRVRYLNGGVDFDLGVASRIVGLQRDETAADSTGLKAEEYAERADDPTEAHRQRDLAIYCQGVTDYAAYLHTGTMSDQLAAVLD